MNQLLKKVFFVGVVLFALTGLSIADPLSDARHAYETGDYVKAAKLLRPQAEQGVVLAQFNLGYMYANGQGVHQDYKEALKWYRMAAENGYAPAQNSLGAMYIKGQGIPQDYKEAVKWYRMAAEQGDNAGQLNLGVMYANGQGVPQDYVRAQMWINIVVANVNSKEQGEHLKVRDFLATKLNAQQIAEAQKLTLKCTGQKFKGC